MDEAPTHVWIGQSGKTYAYRVYPMAGRRLDPVPGNYMLAKLVRSGWYVLYIGQTEDLSARFDYHQSRECLKHHRPTHVMVHVTTGDRQTRIDEGIDLRRALRPPCNMRETVLELSYASGGQSDRSLSGFKDH